jgi:hypothetical protein
MRLAEKASRQDGIALGEFPRSVASQDMADPTMRCFPSDTGIAQQYVSNIGCHYSPVELPCSPESGGYGIENFRQGMTSRNFLGRYGLRVLRFVRLQLLKLAELF